MGHPSEIGLKKMVVSRTYQLFVSRMGERDILRMGECCLEKKRLGSFVKREGYSFEKERPDFLETRHRLSRDYELRFLLGEKSGRNGSNPGRRRMLQTRFISWTASHSKTACLSFQGYDFTLYTIMGSSGFPTRQKDSCQCQSV
jgi:hypothetical protein